MSTETHAKKMWTNPCITVMSTTTTDNGTSRCGNYPTIFPCDSLIGTNLIQNCIDICNGTVSFDKVGAIMIVNEGSVTTGDFLKAISVLTKKQQLIANTLMSQNKIFYTTLAEFVSAKDQILAYNWLDTANFFLLFVKHLGKKITDEE